MTHGAILLHRAKASIVTVLPNGRIDPWERRVLDSSSLTGNPNLAGHARSDPMQLAAISPSGFALSQILRQEETLAKTRVTSTAGPVRRNLPSVRLVRSLRREGISMSCQSVHSALNGAAWLRPASPPLPRLLRLSSISPAPLTKRRSPG